MDLLFAAQIINNEVSQNISNQIKSQSKKRRFFGLPNCQLQRKLSNFSHSKSSQCPYEDDSNGSQRSQHQFIPQKNNNITDQELSLHVENKELKEQIEALKSQIQANKIFMFMVIHDLKHPTESMINQLGSLQIQLQNHITGLETLLIKSANIKAQIVQNFHKSKNMQINQLFANSRVEKQGSGQPEIKNLMEIHNQSIEILNENPHHNVPKISNQMHTNILDSGKIINASNRERRQKKVEMLNDEFYQFFQTHINNLGYLVDGNTYKLSFTLQHNEDSEQFIQAISTTLIKSETYFSEKDILPKLKSLALKQKQIQNEGENQKLQKSEIEAELESIEVNISKTSFEMTKCIQKLRMMTFSSEIMRTLMMDLLDLAQMENSTFRLNKSFFNMHDVVNTAFGIVSHVAQNKQVVLEFKDTTEQEGAYYTALFGDQSRFLQVMINFLSNALKFSEKESKVVVFLKMLENQTLSIGDHQMKQLVLQSMQRKRQNGLMDMQIQSEQIFKRKNINSNSELLLSLSEREKEPQSNGSRSMQLEIENSFHSKNEESGGLDVKSVAKKFEESNQIQEELKQEVLEENYTGQTCYFKFELGIQDFGCGIPKDKLDSLFINFNNLEQHHKKNPAGRGLGLSICKMIVESMGGTVKVQSEEGKGSIFSIIFKVMCKVPEDRLLKSSRHKELKQLNSFQNISRQRQNQIVVGQPEIIPDKVKPIILIVNDDPFLLLGYKEQLEHFFLVETAENGLQAVQIVHSRPINFFDAIILDINMPIMNGYEACNLIQKYITRSGDDVNLNIDQLDSLQELPFKQKPLIYALTSDFSEESNLAVREHPFNRKFECLNNDKEVLNILEDINQRACEIKVEGANINQENQESIPFVQDRQSSSILYLLDLAEI